MNTPENSVRYFRMRHDDDNDDDDDDMIYL
jgi:hypothetical protein